MLIELCALYMNHCTDYETVPIRILNNSKGINILKQLK